MSGTRIKSLIGGCTEGEACAWSLLPRGMCEGGGLGPVLPGGLPEVFSDCTWLEKPAVRQSPSCLIALLWASGMLASLLLTWVLLSAVMYFAFGEQL